MDQMDLMTRSIVTVAVIPNDIYPRGHGNKVELPRRSYQMFCLILRFAFLFTTSFLQRSVHVNMDHKKKMHDDVMIGPAASDISAETGVDPEAQHAKIMAVQRKVDKKLFLWYARTPNHDCAIRHQEREHTDVT
jgi:hypothetical protein